MEEDGKYIVDLTTNTLDFLVQGHPQITLPSHHVNIQKQNKMADVLQNQAMAVIRPLRGNLDQNTSVRTSDEPENKTVCQSLHDIVSSLRVTPKPLIELH